MKGVSCHYSKHIPKSSEKDRKPFLDCHKIAPVSCFWQIYLDGCWKNG